MPNWCMTVWTITGKKDDIDAIEEMKFDFEKILPMPAILKQTEGKNSQEIHDENIRQTGCQDWYDWCVANWGTKWTAGTAGSGDGPTIDRDDDETLVSRMSTAWAPPIGIIRKLAEDYPSTRFRIYCEGEGMEFVGLMEFFGGEMVKNTVHEPSKGEVDEWMARNGIDTSLYE